LPEFGQGTEKGRGLVGVDPFLLVAVEKELVEIGIMAADMKP
jgi:hypothetical protein